jgi:hypothetical protein
MTQKQATRQSTKSVQIIARVQFKADPRKVCYLVRSSDGESQYTTCLFNGKACSCDCASKKPCYHMAGAESKEQERAAFQERAIELAKAREESAAELDAEPVWVRMPNGTQRLAHQVNDACLNSLNEMTEQYAAEVVAHEEAKSEAKMQAFQRGMEEQYASDPRPTTSKQRQDAPLQRQGFSLLK